MFITRQSMDEARERLGGIIHRTDIIPSPVFSKKSGNEVFIKTENLQKTGSFKIRGAYNKIASLSDEERSVGVIAASAGNHAQGVALAAGMFNIPSVIVMPEGAPLAKITATKDYGAKVVLHGATYDDAQIRAYKIQRQTGAVFIHPFNDEAIIAGQGTVGLEIMEDIPDVDVIVVPVGGGGIASGIAVAAKSINPGVKVVGVEAANAASMHESIKADRIVSITSVNTIADGIAVKRPGEITYAYCREYLDDIVRVEEDEIAGTILTLIEKSKIVAEGAGAAAIAAVEYNKLKISGKKIAAVLTGGNIDVNILARIIDKGLVKAGRKVEIKTIIADKPGQLNRLLELISNTGANVVSVHHDRTEADVGLGYAMLELVLETNDQMHMYSILSLLREKQYKPLNH